MKVRKVLTPVLVLIIICLIYNLFWGILYMQRDEFSDKIWLHRCNSLEKLNEQRYKYSNVEVDLVFRENGKLDVTHNPDTTFGLFVDSYFSFLKNNDGRIWLDIKNLNPDNQYEMLTELNYLTSTYHVDKNRLIIESPDWRSLHLFTLNGYYTSCYVPYDKPNRLSKEELNSCIVELQDIADSKFVRALSFPGWWYAPIKQNLKRSIDLLTWKHRTVRLELFSLPSGRRMAKDPQLKVILIKDKGKYHR